MVFTGQSVLHSQEVFPTQHYINVFSDEALCWELAAKARDLYPSLEHSLATNSQPSLLTDRIRNWPKVYYDYDFDFIIGLTLAGFMYGGLHLVAWNGHFASYAEHILWRISALALVGSGPAFIIYFFGWDLSFSCFFEVIKGVWFYPLALLYVFARVFLVVECFLNIRHLPDVAYQVPQWSQYLTHIS